MGESFVGKNFHNFCPFFPTSTHEINVLAILQKLFPCKIGKKCRFANVTSQNPFEFWESELRKLLHFR